LSFDTRLKKSEGNDCRYDLRRCFGPHLEVSSFFVSLKARKFSGHWLDVTGGLLTIFTCAQNGIVAEMLILMFS
jgi:hypothetical protein